MWQTTAELACIRRSELLREAQAERLARVARVARAADDGKAEAARALGAAIVGARPAIEKQCQ